MYIPTVIGVDPGLVHTGVVSLEFDLVQRRLTVNHAAFDGLDAVAVGLAIETWHPDKVPTTLDIFIEHYVPRSAFGVDERMVQANKTFETTLQGKLLRNTGVTKIVSRELMELLNVWSFPTSTHHQDLRSAARIALLGMMLDGTLNKLLYTFVVDQLDGRNWDVRAN
jgi:hypothetical protein